MNGGCCIKNQANEAAYAAAGFAAGFVHSTMTCLGFEFAAVDAVGWGASGDGDAGGGGGKGEGSEAASGASALVAQATPGAGNEQSSRQQAFKPVQCKTQKPSLNSRLAERIIACADVAVMRHRRDAVGVLDDAAAEEAADEADQQPCEDRQSYQQDQQQPPQHGGALLQTLACTVSSISLTSQYQAARSAATWQTAVATATEAQVGRVRHLPFSKVFSTSMYNRSWEHKRA